MAEREAQPAPNLIPAEIPTKSVEIKVRAQALAQGLINDPTLIPELFKAAENYGLSDDPTVFRERRGQMIGFLSVVGKEVDVYNWSEKLDDKLPSDASRSILLYLRPLDQKSKPTRQQEIVEKIANGWINKRFERKPVNDWRKAVFGLRDLLESAVLPESDLAALTAWFNLMVGKYPTAIARNTSVAWRAFGLGAKAAAPFDEYVLAAATDLERGMSVVSELLERRGEYQENSQVYDSGLSLQYGAVFAMLRAGIEVTTREGLYSYRKTIQEEAKKRGYNIQQAILYEIPTDVLDAVLSSTSDMDRFMALMNAINAAYYRTQTKKTMLNLASVGLKKDGSYEFPFNVQNRSSQLQDQLVGLLDSSSVKQSLYEVAQQTAAERGKGRVYPFAVRGLSGYVILDKALSLSPTERIKRIADLIEEHNIREEWLKQKQAIPEAVSVDFSYPGYLFIISSKEYATKTNLASLLDLKIPDESLRKVNETFTSSLSLERSIPQNFTRMPTFTGDKYTLVGHPDLPDVIESAVVRKTPGGGLEYTLNFVTDPLIFPDGEKPVSAGTVNFKFGMVNITPDEFFSSLPVDQRWILKGAILRLIERSCCPTLKEIEEEMQQYEKNGGINNQSIPGYVGHVGGFRASGERKQYTKGAEENFTAVVGELFDETGGISLGRLNEKHRQEDPSDDRFLTYYKGSETNQPQEPKPRKSPDKLLPTA